MITVKQILEKKGSDYYHVSSSTPVAEALKKMALKNVGGVLVIDEEKLVGMFTERDYARKALNVENSGSPTISMFMSKSVVTVTPSMTINECMAIMTNKHVRHLPVLDNNVICGLISIGDVVNAVIQEQFSTIRDLEKYITGGYGTV